MRAAQRIVSIACVAALVVTCAWLMLLTPGARASSCTAEVEYTGASNGSWQTAANWSGNAVPTGSQTVCIPTGKGTIEVPAAATAHAKTLVAQSALKIVSTGTLAIAETVTGAATVSTFAGLEIEAGGHLTTAGGWIFLSGSIVLDGEISRTNPVEAFVKLVNGTLGGSGTIAVEFNNEAGTMEPGGAGVIGELHFTMLSSQGEHGTLVLDLASAGSFDRMSDTTSNFFLGGTLDLNLLGGYEPAVGTTWEYMSGGPGDSTEYNAITPGFSAESVPGGSLLTALPRPPVAVTEPASAVLQTTATLNGTVNPNHENVISCKFEYGTSTAYGVSIGCGGIPSLGSSPVPTAVGLSGLAAGTTYHFRIVAKNEAGTGEGVDRTFTTLAAATGGSGEPTQPEATGGASTTGTTASVTGGSTTSLVSSIGGGGSPGLPLAVATAPKAVEELLLGCSKRSLVLNDVLIRGRRVALNGSAAKSLVGKKVKIIFDSGKPVASATVQANGQFSTTAPLPPARLRNSNSARYIAESGAQRSLDLKLTRRVNLEPPKFAGGRVTLVGQVVAPLTKPVAPVSVEQQLECGKSSKVLTFTPPASGRFQVTISGIPANAKAGIYRLSSIVAQSTASAKHGFPTFSLPLPVALG
jgi:hypothetical protein